MERSRRLEEVGDISGALVSLAHVIQNEPNRLAPLIFATRLREKLEKEAGENMIDSRLTMQHVAKALQSFQTKLSQPAIQIENFLNESEILRLLELNEDLDGAFQGKDVFACPRGMKAKSWSNATFLFRHDDALIDDIAERLESKIGLLDTHGLGFQILKYGEGAEYGPHTDCSPGVPGMDRMFTALIYLKSPPRGGGETCFANEQCFAPKAGTLLLFSSYDEHGKCNKASRHWATPVYGAEKIVLQRWYNYLPTPLLGERGYHAIDGLLLLREGHSNPPYSSCISCDDSQRRCRLYKNAPNHCAGFDPNTCEKIGKG